MVPPSGRDVSSSSPAATEPSSSAPDLRLTAAATVLRRLLVEQLAAEPGGEETARHLVRLAAGLLPEAVISLVRLRGDGELELPVLQADRTRVWSTDSVPDAEDALVAGAWRHWPRGSRTSAEPVVLAGGRGIFVTLALQRKPLGTLVAQWPTTDEVADADVAVLAALAEGAGLLLAQARISERSRLWRRWLRTSKRVNAALVSRNGVSLSALAETLLSLDNADLVSVVVPTDDGTSLRIAAAASSALPALADRLRGQQFDNNPDTLAGAAMRSGRSQRVRAVSDMVNPIAAQVQNQIGPHLAVPLSGETPQGVITLSRLAGAAPFTDDDVELAELLAHQVGMAWRLGRDQQEHHHITLLQDRDRVNRLRNDEVLQRLFALGVALQSLPRQDWDDEQRRTLDRITGEFDDLTRHIRPIVVTRNQNATTLTALTAMIEAELAPLVASLGFRPRLEVQQGEAEVPTTLVPVVVSVVYDLTRAAATNPQISALTCRLGVEDDWLLVDATEQGSNSTAEWSYPLRHELESRADEFDGLCTVTSAGPDHRHITWRIPM